MEECSHVLCLWEGRLWPAKVLPKNAHERNFRRRKDINVEILGKEQRVQIAESDTRPLTQGELDSLCHQMAPKVTQPVEELRYRKALRLAMNVLSSSLSPSDGGSPRRSYRLNPAPAMTLPHLPSTLKVGTESVPPKVRSSTGDQQGAAASSDSAASDTGRSKAKKQPRARGGKASARLAQDRSGQDLHRNRKQGKRKGQHPRVTPRRNGLSQDSVSSTPRRPTPSSRRRHLLSSTPDTSKGPSSRLTESPGSPPAEELSKQEEDLVVKPRRRKSRNQAESLKVTKGRRCQSNGSSSDTPPVTKRRKRVCMEASNPAQSNGCGVQPPARHRARFEPAEESEDPAETSMSSDLSIELSFPEDPAPLDSFLQDEGDDEDEEEEEELPSFLEMEKKPMSITEGILVWCKIRNFPFWPAVVKSVNRKLKKASVVFIDNLLLDKKSRHKGIRISLRTLKPFDCEEMNELVIKAREKYDTAVSWCLNLINDYKIRIGNEFHGSFLEYFASDISGPVRRRCVLGGAELTFPVQLGEEEEDVEGGDKDEQDGANSTEDDHQGEAKLMPDRERAARDKANQRLVDFIVDNQGLEAHLQAVISGVKPSRWVRYFLNGRCSVTVLYLEDDGQVDQVYQYLLKVYKTAPQVASCLTYVDEVRLITDVLLPEAVIRAMCAVESLSEKAAESKYLKGACRGKREKAEFDRMIERQLKLRAKNQRRRELEELD
ncbi:hypothetical protein GJAV_G00110770 [Gymnothorax javanicus]|nr:hypothetical protein GJAV_G00110770 [Gymnothorax javanicus]